MEYLVTGRQAKAIDTYTIEHTGIPSLVLMERASLTIAEETAQVAAQLKLPAVRIAAVCGSGNNGGDGIAAARILHSRGYDITIFFAGLREKMSPDCQKQLSIAENLSVPISNDTDLDAYNIIIDAIFGIGLDRPVTGTYKDWITAVNSASENGSKVIAVDTPSGIHTDSGQIMGTAVHADRTVTFGYIKKGLVLYPGASCAGKVICRDIGFDPAAAKTIGLQYITYTKEDYKRLPNGMQTLTKELTAMCWLSQAARIWQALLIFPHLLHTEWGQGLSHFILRRVIAVFFSSFCLKLF